MCFISSVTNRFSLPHSVDSLDAVSCAKTCTMDCTRRIWCDEQGRKARRRRKGMLLAGGYDKCLTHLMATTNTVGDFRCSTSWVQNADIQRRNRKDLCRCVHDAQAHGGRQQPLHKMTAGERVTPNRMYVRRDNFLLRYTG